MKPLLRSVISIGVAGLVGCTSTGAWGPRPAFVEVPVQGTYSHVVTGLEFPEVMGPFIRVAVRLYDPRALDVAAHYQLPGEARAMATVYHYPDLSDGPVGTADALARNFRLVQEDVARTHPSLRLISASPHRARINGFEYPGFKAVYEADRFPGVEGPVRSVAYLFAIGNWFLKFRFTYVPELAAALEPSEQHFVSSIHWQVPADFHVPESPCERLAFTYELVAKSRDLGLTRDDQLELASQMGDAPSDQPMRGLVLNAIDVVSANPGKDSGQIRDLVVGDCELSEQGDPTLRTLWSRD